MPTKTKNRLITDLVSNHWHIVFLFFLCFTFSYIDRQVVAILVEPLQAHFRLSDIQIGILQGFSFTMCYATAGVLVAYLVDRSNRVRLVVICVAVWSISTILCGFAQSFPQLLVARAGTAIAEAAISPAAISIFSDLYTAKRIGRANSLFMLGPYIGGGVALLGGGFILDYLAHQTILSSLEPWQEVFIIVGLPGILLAALVASYVKEPARQSITGTSDNSLLQNSATITTPSFMDTIREIVFRHEFCVPYFLGYMSLIVLFYSYSAWFPTVLIRDFGLSAHQAGEYAGPVFMLGGIGGVVFASILVRNLADETALRYVLKLSAQASTVLIPIAVIAPIAGSVFLSLLLYGLTAFTASIIMAIVPIPVQVAMPNRMRGRVIALLVFLTNAISGGLGPYAVGAINESLFHTGDHTDVALAVVCGVTAAGSAAFYYIASIKTGQKRHQVAAL